MGCMEIDLIKRVIQSQREEIGYNLLQVKERDGLQEAAKFLKFPNVLAITGVRRCGKSIFSLLVAQNIAKNYGYLNFFDERLIGFKAEDFEKLEQAFLELIGEPDLIILDEVQEVPGCELFVSRLRRTKKVIITGSNSTLLSGELSTYLTGRHLDITLWPYSFSEKIGSKPNTFSIREIAETRKKYQAYLQEGGFPEVEKFGKEIIKIIYQDIINKDCLRRYTIREEEAFRRLSHYLLSNYSSEFTYSKLSKILEIKDQHTVANYVGYLKDSFLLLVLERYSPKLKQQIIAPKKVYAADHALGNFVGFGVSRNIGRIFENIVLVELVRRKKEVYYYKDHQQREVDFVVKEGKVKQLIQVCYDITNIKTKERELDGLTRASRQLRCNDLLVITNDYESIEGKVRFIPLWKWLLQ